MLNILFGPNSHVVLDVVNPTMVSPFKVRHILFNSVIKFDELAPALNLVISMLSNKSTPDEMATGYESTILGVKTYEQYILMFLTFLVVGS